MLAGITANMLAGTVVAKFCSYSTYVYCDIGGYSYRKPMTPLRERHCV